MEQNVVCFSFPFLAGAILAVVFFDFAIRAIRKSSRQSRIKEKVCICANCRWYSTAGRNQLDGICTEVSNPIEVSPTDTCRQWSPEKRDDNEIFYHPV